MEWWADPIGMSFASSNCGGVKSMTMDLLPRHYWVQTGSD